MATVAGVSLLLEVLWARWTDSRYRLFLLADLSPQWQEAVRAKVEALDLSALLADLTSVLSFDPSLYDRHLYDRLLLQENLPRQRFSLYMHRWTKKDVFRPVSMPPEVHLTLALLHQFPVPHLLPIDPSSFAANFDALSETMAEFARTDVPFLLIYPIAQRSSKAIGGAPRPPAKGAAKGTAKAPPKGPSKAPPKGAKNAKSATGDPEEPPPPLVYPSTFLVYVHSESPDLVSVFRRSRHFMLLTVPSGRPSFAPLCRRLATNAIPRRSASPFYTNTELINLCNTAPYYLESLLTPTEPDG